MGNIIDIRNISSMDIYSLSDEILLEILASIEEMDEDSIEFCENDFEIIKDELMIRGLLWK